MEQQIAREPMRGKKLLYAASTASHLKRFHMPYIEELRKICDVKLMAKGEGVDFSVPFEKSLFSPSNLRAIRQIRKILRQENFDAVIVNTSLAAFLIRAAMRGMRSRPRVLNIVHGYLFADPPKGMKDRLLLLCEKMTRKQTDRIAVMNAADENIVDRWNFCLENAVLMRGMGFDLPQTLPERDASLRLQYAPEPDDCLLTFVGELSNRKNQIFLIRAVERLRREGLPVRLMLVGEGGERAELESEIRRLNLEQSVFLTGNREPVLPYLGITDLYVSASRSEGLPFNIMEAMACGLPIIASDVKGQNDLLRGMPERLYPAGDMDAFCKAVRDVFTAGEKGIGSVVYPELEQYRLESVFAENMELMKGMLL